MTIDKAGKMRQTIRIAMFSCIAILAVILLSVTSTLATEVHGIGTVCSEGSLNVRSGPGTDYESIGKVDSGAMVDVIGMDDSQEWYKISFVGQEGYVSASYVDFEQDEEEFIEEEEEIETETDASPAEATDEEVEEAPQNYKVIFGLLGAIVVLFFIILVTIKSIKKMDEDEDVEDEEEEYDEDEEEYEEEYDEDEEEYDEDEEEYEEEYDEDEEEYDEDEDEYDDDAYEYQTITIRRPKQSTLDRQKKNDDYLIDIDPSYFD